MKRGREREEAPHQGQASIIIIVLIWKLHSLLRSAPSRPVSLESQPPSQHSTSLAMVTILSSVSTLVTILQINPESQMRMVLRSEILWLHTKRLSKKNCENSLGLNTAIGWETADLQRVSESKKWASAPHSALSRLRSDIGIQTQRWMSHHFSGHCQTLT